ncbi:MAG: CARDB domain-containing protein [Sulfurospirillum sp.]
MKWFSSVLGVLLLTFSILVFSGNVTDLQANYLKKAYNSVKKKAKKIVHKGRKYVKKGKRIFYKGKVIGKSVRKGYIAIGKRIYKTTRSASKGVFKIGKIYYSTVGKGLVFVGKTIIYDGLLLGEVLGHGLVKVDGVVYEVAKGVKVSAAAANDLVLGRMVYRRKGSHGRARRAKFPDLLIDKVYLNRRCQVLVRVRNAGKGKIPVAVWTKRKPKSSSVYLKVNGRSWGGATIWKFDRRKKLLKPGGAAVYKSNLKVKGSETITAIVDITREVRESNERNNIKSVKLKCASNLSFKPIGKKPLFRKILPDLVVKSIKMTTGCGIRVTIANITKGRVPVSGYDSHNGVALQMYNNNKPWGGIRLSAVDKGRKLSKGRGAISFIWFPGAKNLKLKSGKNRIKLVIDTNHAVKESNERNNARVKLLTCMRPVVNLGKVGKIHIVGKPDLVITSFGLKKWGVCKPKSAVLIFAVTIKNRGNKTSPDIGRKALIQVMDQDGSRWGNGAIVGALKPNQSKTVLVRVYYLQSNPEHMVKNAPHPFIAIADPLHIVKESNEANNKTRVIKIGAPKNCVGANTKFISGKVNFQGLTPLKIKKPDLVVKSLSLDNRCNIVVKIANQGEGSVPDSAYNVTDKTFLVLHDGSKLLGGISLANVDFSKKLQKKGASITSTWNPGNFNKTMPWHTIKATVDYGKIVKESNENNNNRVVKLRCKNRKLKDIGKIGVKIPKQKGSSSKTGIKKNIPKKINKVMPNQPVEAPKQMPQGGTM